MTPDDFWAWVDAGCPQRWAVWRMRDEVDGLACGALVGLAVVCVGLVAG